jgi:divalent metal cation (Fe/Co/Zn/Cd) transporter
VLVHVEPSNLIVALPEDNNLIMCMRDELLKDQRVRKIKDLKFLRYRNDIRIEAELVLDPGVTLAESGYLLMTSLKN